MAVLKKGARITGADAHQAGGRAEEATTRARASANWRTRTAVVRLRPPGAVRVRRDAARPRRRDPHQERRRARPLSARAADRAAVGPTGSPHRESTRRPASGSTVHRQVATVTLEPARPAQRADARTPGPRWSRVRASCPATVRVVVAARRGPCLLGRAGPRGCSRRGHRRRAGVVELAAMPPDEASARDRRATSRPSLALARPTWSASPRCRATRSAPASSSRSACDLRVARRGRAVHHGRGRRSGLVPDLGGTKRLVDLVGYSRARRDLPDRPAGRRRGGAADRPGLARGRRATSSTRAVERTVAALLAVDRDAAAETKALLLARRRPHARTSRRRPSATAQYRRLRALAGLDAED